MTPSLRNLVWAMSLLLLPAAAGARAGDTDPPAGVREKVEESVEVERADVKGPKHPSLQFLRDNRVFLRAQIDRLRTKITLTRAESAEILDERYLRLSEMSEALAAARDTVRDAHALSARRELLDNVTELGDLDAELALMEALLDDQRKRLLMLEEDFLGHQETALVVVLEGLSGRNAPVAIVLAEDNDAVRIELTPEQQSSLERGGIAQIYHEFIEPREHVFHITFGGDGWETTGPVAVPFEVIRDRLTFLELDLSRLDPDREAAGLATNIWYR